MSTNRDYLPRMMDEKVKCMEIAKLYDKDYWDGERRYGYGGYKYIPGWWTPVAKSLVDNYGLTNSSSVLDVGCGKGYLLYELKQLLPGLKIAGFDISEYGLKNAKENIKTSLFKHSAQSTYPYDDNEFDLVISLGCIHNLRLFELEKAVKEIERVGRNGYIVAESYRNSEELFNLQCWALTCETFLDYDEWLWLYNKFGYMGDYEFIFFE